MKAIDEKTGKIIDLGLGCTFGVFIRLDFSRKGLPILREKAPDESKPTVKPIKLQKNPSV